MTAIEQLWQLTSFRQSFVALCELPEAEARAIVEYVKGTDEGLVSDDAVTTDREKRLLVPLVQALIRIRNQDGLSALEADLVELNDPTVSQAVPMLLSLLGETAAEKAQRIVRQAQSATLPIVEAWEVTVDFRATGESEGTVASLVPVVRVRLTFDEPVNGNESVVFQVPDEVAVRLPRELQAADKLRSDIMRELPEHLLPEGLRPYLWEWPKRDTP